MIMSLVSCNLTLASHSSDLEKFNALFVVVYLDLYNETFFALELVLMNRWLATIDPVSC